MSATYRPLLAAVLLTAALAACQDPYAPEAQFEVVTDTFAIYGINDAPLAAPTAVSLFNAVTGVPAVTAAPNFSFDFALDVADDGTITLLPNSRVANRMLSPHRVGFQRVDVPFASLTAAPASGYTFDSLLVVAPGQTIAIQSADPNACPVPYLGTWIYAKFVIDSVAEQPARIFVRTTVDANCDFRSLLPGIPED